VFAAGCDPQPPTSPDPEPSAIDGPAAHAVTSFDRPDIAHLLAGIDPAANPREGIAGVNERLAARGLPIAVYKVEYVTGGPGATEVGQTVFATDRQLQLDSKWVPGDERRLATGNLVTQITSLPFSPANFGTPDQIDGIPPIDTSFDTWNDVTCSNLDILTLAPTPDIDSAVFGIGDPFVADIVTIGFLPGVFFDLVLGPGAADVVVGVTFTAWFIDGPGGPPTDVDNNGRLDTALKEVWYNDDFVWSTDETPGTIDIETVALHENGHALELGHFGRVAIGNRTGKLHVSPRAVMNAFILGTLRAPLGTDSGAYCGNFGSWPD
jgi:hypothetical protein